MNKRLRAVPNLRASKYTNQYHHEWRQGLGAGIAYSTGASDRLEKFEIYSFDPTHHTTFLSPCSSAIKLVNNGEYSTFPFPTTRNHFDHT